MDFEDGQGAHNEMEPLCVLDFYVHISLQRHGYGKELFDYMVQYEGIKPDHLAIDRPSSKFLSFLRKHYGLAATILQVNNFVVFESFFQDRQMRGARLVQRSAPKKVEQDIKPYSITVREGAPEDQELPWPFNQASSLTRSNSLGCSSRLIQPGQQEGPRRIRGLRSQLLNGAREADDTSAQRRRTCNVPVQKELVTAGEACATSGTPSPSLDLGQEKSAGPCEWHHSFGVGPGQKSSGRIHHPGHGGTGSPRVQDGQLIPSDPKDAAQDPNPLPSGVFPPAQLPQPPPTLDQGAGGGPGAREGLIRREREEVVWSPWAETQLPSQAQWIRHKNKFRNTRPW
ncbi:alpha-tubulin N-acetyltransferase 1 [Narcine bancroftii]|uniref:alpha-tubulin N-acetyltransferase 1 n=1 Tax=Narcine bancroftii TaxID=1343680 RepID=UPI003831E8C1